MLGTYYYHEIIRKTIIGFGTLMIFLLHENIDNTTLDQTKVGRIWATAKFLQKLENKQT